MIVLQAIVAGIEAVDVVPGRTEIIDEGQSFPVIVDSANTPEALSRQGIQQQWQWPWQYHLCFLQVMCISSTAARNSRSVKSEEQSGAGHHQCQCVYRLLHTTRVL